VQNCLSTKSKFAGSETSLESKDMITSGKSVFVGARVMFLDRIALFP